jgi:hypothetical protein
MKIIAKAAGEIQAGMPSGGIATACKQGEMQEVQGLAMTNSPIPKKQKKLLTEKPSFLNWLKNYYKEL